MAALRFPTLRALCESFPTAHDDIGIDPDDAPSLDLLRMLAAAGMWDAAITFCAYLLPRREAVWWGCQSVRRMLSLAPPEEEALALAEAWVREPEEHRRRAALACGYGGDRGLPAIWLALAAGWSGGSIVAPQFGHVPPAPEQTARAVRAGMMLARARLPAEQAGPTLAQAIDYAAALARAG